jgi:hypothetical protein
VMVFVSKVTLSPSVEEAYELFDRQTSGKSILWQKVTEPFHIEFKGKSYDSCN